MSFARGLIRLLSFNIQAGATTRNYSEYVTRSLQHVLPSRDKQRNLIALASVIRDFDLVGLQEADSGSLRSGFVNQSRFLAEGGGFKHLAQQSNRRIGVIAASSNSLLSRVAPVAAHDYALPGRISGRGALVVEFGHGEKQLAVCVVHLALGPAARAGQLAFIQEITRHYPRRIIMGDFNCTPKQAELQHFMHESGLVLAAPTMQMPTYPSWQPARQIDHVLISEGLSVVQVQTLPVVMSDHLPVAVTVRISDLPASKKARR
jgi:endonuclease/exonuclease/phosphatase family metal-dependent hydrolase